MLYINNDSYIIKIVVRKIMIKCHLLGRILRKLILVKRRHGSRLKNGWIRKKRIKNGEGDNINEGENYFGA